MGHRGGGTGDNRARDRLPRRTTQVKGRNPAAPSPAGSTGHALTEPPLLVGAAVAVPEVELGAVGRAEGRVVEATAGDRVDERAVPGFPLLVRAVVAVPDLGQAAVGGAGAGDVQALPVDLQRAAGERPPLRPGGVAVPDVDLRAGRRGAGVVIEALAADARGDRAGRRLRGSAARGD